MSTKLTFGQRTQGSGRIWETTTGLQQTARWGDVALPNISWNFEYGTGNQQIDKWYLDTRTLAATTYDDLDLAGGVTDFQGNAITFTKIKRAFLAVLDPDGTKKVRFGPQGRTNAAQLWFGGTAAAVYEEVVWYTDRIDTYTGWTVTAGTGDILSVYNPTGSSLSYTIWLMGV